MLVLVDLLGIIFNVISPIFIVVGLSVLLARRFNPDPRPLATLLIYLFIPALAFWGIASSDLSGGEIARIAASAIIISVLMALAGLVIARLAGFERQLESGFLLCLILMNAANYGISFNTFAFGDPGAQRAVIFYASSVVAGNILGVYFASRGSVGVGQSLRNVLRVPITYAALAGLAVNLADITLPLPLARAAEITSDAAIPVMLALLGVQLSRTQVIGRWRAIWLAAGSRLVLAPLLALPMVFLLGFTDPSDISFQVIIIQSAMPTAVLAIALATEFNSDAGFVAAATLVNTLVSVITLSVILLLLSS